MASFPFQCRILGCSNVAKLKFCDEHRCKSYKCNDFALKFAPISGHGEGNFCSAHTCGKKDCGKERHGYNHCREHRCQFGDNGSDWDICGKERHDSYKFCKDHICPIEGCSNSLRECEEHRCTARLCDQIKVSGRDTCSKHSCHGDPECNSPPLKWDDSIGLCANHFCPVCNGLYNPRECCNHPFDIRVIGRLFEHIPFRTSLTKSEVLQKVLDDIS